jgi:outer membrane lipopolysaccharide assembly protein LptE/RlpB
MKAYKMTGLGLLLCLMLWGCGYHLTGQGASQLPPHLNTIAIPVFENKSLEPTVQRPLTEALRLAFITDGRLRLVNNKAEADLVITGTVTNYWIRAIAFNEFDVATEYWVNIEADILVEDQVKDLVYLKQKLKTRWNYRANPGIVSTEAARQAALTETYRVMSQRLVSLVNDKF